MTQARSTSTPVASLESLEGRQLLSAWGGQSTLIGLDKVASQFPTVDGRGTSIAIIDSGVAYTHPSLGNGWGNKVVAGYDFVNNDTDPMSNSYAHGTGSAGMAAASPFDYKNVHYSGIAPGAKIVALRENNTDGVNKSLQWVIDHKSQYNIVAANVLDYGGGNGGMYAKMKSLMSTLNSMGVYITVPSGNGGASKVNAAHDANIVEVGSVSKGDGISGFTQRGPGLDFLAPGEKVGVTYYDVGKKQAMYVDTGDGTSWAAPQVAGAAALIRQINPQFSNGQITSILKDSGVQKYDSATKRSYARLNLYAAVQLAYQRSGQAAPAPVTPVPSSPEPDPTPAPTPSAPGGVTASTPTNLGTNTVLQLEDFDAGAEGAAYHDVQSANLGGNAYRAGGVDVITLNDSGSTRGVGFAKAGEWLKYTVNVQSAGTYSLNFRLSALGAGGAFHLEVDGKNVTGTLAAPDTKNWNSYATVTKAGVALTGGKHTLRLVMDKNGKSGYVANFNQLTLTKAGTAASPAPALPAPVTVGGGNGGSPFRTVSLSAGTATTIQAEDFDNGAAGVAYKDTTSKNEGGQYRANVGVDIEKSLDTGGGFDVGYLKQGEWLTYTVGVAKAGTFNLDARIASQYANGAFHVEVDGRNVTGTIKFSNTGGYQKWATVRKGGIAIAAGTHTVKLVVDATGSGKFAGNVNWLKFS